MRYSTSISTWHQQRLAISGTLHMTSVRGPVGRECWEASAIAAPVQKISLLKVLICGGLVTTCAIMLAVSYRTSMVPVDKLRMQHMALDEPVVIPPVGLQGPQASTTNVQTVKSSPGMTGPQASATIVQKDKSSTGKSRTRIEVRLTPPEQHWLMGVLKAASATRRGGQTQGGAGALSDTQLDKLLADPKVFDTWGQLLGFTGLTDLELRHRMLREGTFHFETEHAYANPRSATELAWFYSTSVNYLFANAVHPGYDIGLTPEDGPVLEYSGGVGNTVILMAKKGIHCVYFGIGMMEFAFAEYRVKRLGLESFVTFLKPYSNETGWRLDPRNALPSGTYRTILALDVLEHIPLWDLTVKTLVRSLRPGGRIIEHSPFAEGDIATSGTDKDVRVHVGRGNITMAEAMGPMMSRNGTVGSSRSGVNIWIKSKDR